MFSEVFLYLFSSAVGARSVADRSEGLDLGKVDEARISRRLGVAGELNPLALLEMLHPCRGLNGHQAKGSLIRIARDDDPLAVSAKLCLVDRSHNLNRLPHGSLGLHLAFLPGEIQKVLDLALTHVVELSSNVRRPELNLKLEQLQVIRLNTHCHLNLNLEIVIHCLFFFFPRALCPDF